MSITFDKLNLNKDMIEGLKNLKITEATEVQEKAIPLALEGKNILAQSETGTGKTLAYLLPLIEKLQKDKKEMQAIILAPTYELCMQIHNTILELKKESGMTITSTQLIGSANIARQIEKLKDRPNILVGSAGRVLELIKKKKITTGTIKTVVLDEVDKLLDNKNITLIKEILKSNQKVDQLMMFSATINNSSLQLSKELVEELEVIRVKGSNKVNEDITHNYIMVEERKKVEYLRKLIHAARPKRAIVFISNSFNVDQTLEKLKFHKINAATIHGDIDKDERKRALESFRKGKIQVLVASDVAARGLDIKGVTHVINLDTPRDPKNYLHRVGRVGRAGEKGEAYSLVDNRDLNNIRVYEKDLKLKFNRKYVYMGKVLQD